MSYCWQELHWITGSIINNINKQQTSDMLLEIHIYHTITSSSFYSSFHQPPEVFRMVDVSSDVHNWVGTFDTICISNWGKLCSYSTRAIIGVIDLNNYKPWIPDRHFNCSLCNLNKLNTIYLFIAEFPIKKNIGLENIF